MTAKLAIPTFVGGPEDDLAAVDVYTQEQDVVINSIQDTYLEMPGDEEVLGLIGGNAMDKAAQEALDNANQYDKDPNQALSEAMLETVEIKDMTLNMTPSGLAGLKADITGAMGQVKGAIAQAKATVNGVTGMIKGAIADVKATVGAINAMAGSVIAQVNSIKAQVAGLTGIVKQACSLGIPNSFGALVSDVNVLNKLSSQGMAGMNALVGNCMGLCAKVGDFGSLTSMAQCTSPGVMIGMQPSLLSDISSGFKLADSSLGAIKSTYNQVTSCFGAINPSWAQASRNGGVIASITTLQNASRDMSRVITTGAMLSSNITDKVQLLSNKFAPMDVNTSLQTSFSSSFFVGNSPVGSGRAVAPNLASQGPLVDAESGAPITPGVLDIGFYGNDWNEIYGNARIRQDMLPPPDNSPQPTEADVLAAMNQDAATGQAQYSMQPRVTEDTTTGNNVKVETLSNGNTTVTRGTGQFTQTKVYGPDGTPIMQSNSLVFDNPTSTSVRASSQSTVRQLSSGGSTTTTDNADGTTTVTVTGPSSTTSSSTSRSVIGTVTGSDGRVVTSFSDGSSMVTTNNGLKSTTIYDKTGQATVQSKGIDFGAPPSGADTQNYQYDSGQADNDW